MGKRSSNKSLRIHRETVRVLSGRELAGVGGGTWRTSELATVTLVEDPYTDPKSNVWTGDDLGNRGACTVVH